jgi:hypothetical protein
MVRALVLTASWRGRPARASADGPLLVVEDEAPVLIEAWPQPGAWDPDGVRLVRDGVDVGAQAQADRMRWMLLGDQRFGGFQALVEVDGVVVASPVLHVTRAGGPQRSPGAPTSDAVAPAPGAGPLRPSRATSLTTSPDPPEPSGARTPDTPLASVAVPPPAPAIVVLPPDPVPPVLAPTGDPSPEPGRDPSTPRVPAHARPEDLLAEFETPLNEYDGRFTAGVAVLFVVLSSVVVGLIVTRFLGDTAWYLAPKGAGPTPTVDGSSAERIGLGSATLLIALGSVLVLAGAALAALEVRGRQRREPRPHLTARGSGRALGILPRIVDRLVRVPATIAVLTTGGVILALGFIAQAHWAIQI